MSAERDDLTRAFTHLRNLIVPETDALDDLLRAARNGLDRYGDLQERRPIAGVRVAPVDVGGVPGEWLLGPSCKGDRRILLLHGGGIVAGSLHSHRPIASTLAALTDCAVLNIAYRLAPEHVFPAAHDDCAAAFAWLQANGPDGASVAERISIVGDSAGGNLAAATCARVAMDGGALPDKLVLLGPCLDSTADPNRKDLATDPFVNADTVAAILLYAGDTPRDHPDISALMMPDSLLGKFPPTLIQVSGAEFLLPDAKHMAQRMSALRRRVVLSIWPDMPHVWHAFLDVLPEARAALKEVAEFLAAESA